MINYNLMIYSENFEQMLFRVQYSVPSEITTSDQRHDVLSLSMQRHVVDMMLF